MSIKKQLYSSIFWVYLRIIFITYIICKKTPKDDSKIFCIGLNKTGTTSLHHAFEILGFKSIHWRDNPTTTIKHEILKNYLKRKDIITGYHHYDAFSDWDLMGSSQYIFKEFETQYPNSYFIINIRNKEDWLQSRENHNIRVHNLHPDQVEVKIDRSSWIKQYDLHYEEIFKYFEKKKKNI